MLLLAGYARFLMTVQSLLARIANMVLGQKLRKKQRVLYRDCLAGCLVVQVLALERREVLQGMKVLLMMARKLYLIRL
ncbi:hypothetical protein BOV90_03575 [Solemya velum gill symbiont]|nr:hypothetical protein BOV90_03575 [Solemya velum gill symbiont]OOY43716.1 hypothetical protein BOV91_03215 [Solemya velum gill symbiont]OOY45885.1 hypothetical protein BOV92_04210 [Solemya velum gill symbiont]OOY54335.1 hypothetical protein BOV99_11295 [Solemya velum gill symbiont]OOY62589.1 hypothetical protein BOW04_05945 [Solemya velum gill symbiont]